LLLFSAAVFCDPTALGRIPVFHSHSGSRMFITALRQARDADGAGIGSSVWMMCCEQPSRIATEFTIR